MSASKRILARDTGNQSEVQLLSSQNSCPNDIEIITLDGTNGVENGDKNSILHREK